MNKNVSEILKLSLEEKIQAVKAIWDDIAEKNNSVPIHQEQLKIVEDRLESYLKNPSKVRNWEDFKKEFISKK